MVLYKKLLTSLMKVEGTFFFQLYVLQIQESYFQLQQHKSFLKRILIKTAL